MCGIALVRIDKSRHLRDHAIDSCVSHFIGLITAAGVENADQALSDNLILLPGNNWIGVQPFKQKLKIIRIRRVVGQAIFLYI